MDRGREARRGGSGPRGLIPAMVERYKRGKGKKTLLGSHQKCWLWGRNLVLETLAAGRWPLADLFLSDALSPEAMATATSRAETLGVSVSVNPVAALEKLGHTAEHQGYLARMGEFPYLSFNDLPVSGSGGQPAFYVMLDGIQDPFNFGAVLRSAEVFGVDAAIIPASGQVGVTSMVARSSAGAVNRIPIARVESLDAAASALTGRGVVLVGASEKAAREIAACDLRRPVCIVVGNEGMGVSPAILARCGEIVRIPQHGRVGSLNAAVAAGVFFYEVRRQRA
jgi:23S rRNA (guanosine2251-2'-O)-methyltransferase